MDQPELTQDFVSTAVAVCGRLLEDRKIYQELVGILLCGTGQGVAIVANKIAGIYAVRCLSEKDAIASRVTNCANVLCLSAELVPAENARIIETFLSTAIGSPATSRLHQVQLVERNWRKVI